MICLRCKMVVKPSWKNLDCITGRLRSVKLRLWRTFLPSNSTILDNALKQTGLELMSDKKNILVEKIKTIIIEMVHYSDEQIKINLSDYLSEKLNYNYTYLANLFTETKGITIEQFYLEHKIEKVKELLIYDELSLTEIAWKLHYSSVAHLSNQFKKMTGLTPSSFKNFKHKSRRDLRDV